MNKVSIRGEIDKQVGDRFQDLEAIATSETAKTLAGYLLGMIAFAGLTGMYLAAPNSMKLVALFLKKRHKRSFRRKEQFKKLTKAFYYLKQSDQIIIKEKEGVLSAFLSTKGKKRLQQLNARAAINAVRRPEKWNGTWWLVAADIPTRTHRWAADAFRRKLKDLQFHPFQRSLWIHPFDPRQELEYLANRYDLGRFVTVMEIGRLDEQDKSKLINYFRKRRVL